MKFLAPLAILLAVFAPVAALAQSVPPIPVFQKGTRILFQGDSITDGNRGRGPDPNHILGHGYAFIIAAKYGATFAPLDLEFLNRGISGNTVLELQKRWETDTLSLKPDVLSVLIGVNDTSHGVPLDVYEKTYDALLLAAEEANPKLRVVLCEPFTLPSGARKAQWETWWPQIQARQAAVARLAEKHHAAFVRLQSVFDQATQSAPAEHWIWDGVHPTYSGHQLMADAWERTVREQWPTP